ncbi:MAG: aldo/keto reductase family protein [Pseudobdellovibrionaceae bacterium]
MPNLPLPQISPNFFYGTAWKEELTELCVTNALKVGFRAIDTANQRKHYFEEGVGTALKRAYQETGLSRQDLFIQTKFTFAAGQDHRKPYDENAPFNLQVQQSFESSLRHLGTDYLDSYILHGPSSQIGLAECDWEVWSAMEDFHSQGKTKYLGVSNVSFEQLEELFNKSTVKPSFVQNRCFAETKWDKQIRDFCQKNKILYEGFSLLTANRNFLGGKVERPADRNIPHLVFDNETEKIIHPKIQSILKETGKTMQQVIFRFAQQIGMIPVVGTRSVEHMKEDLEAEKFTLTSEQLKYIEDIASL